MKLMVVTHPPTKEAKMKSAHHSSFRKLWQTHLEFEQRPKQCSPTNKQHPKSLPRKRICISRGCASRQPTVPGTRQNAPMHPALKKPLLCKENYLLFSETS